MDTIMYATSTNHRPFRFLDLPAELRLMFYENIEIELVRHTITREQANLDKREWPVPPSAHIHDSQLTLIRPHSPSEILRTCRLVHEEARVLLKRKMEPYKSHPIRYVVDYNAARAIASYRSPLRICLGEADGGVSCGVKNALKEFLQHCQSCLVRQRRPGCGGFRYTRTIDITISHKSDTVYAKDILNFLTSLKRLNYSGLARIVVDYKSILPSMLTLGGTLHDNVHGQSILQGFPRDTESGHRRRIFREVFIKPLNAKAFEEHEKNLESY